MPYALCPMPYALCPVLQAVPVGPGIFGDYFLHFLGHCFFKIKVTARFRSTQPLPRERGSSKK